VVEGTGLENRPTGLISQNGQQNLRFFAAPLTPEFADSGQFRSQKRIQCGVALAMPVRLVASDGPDATRRRGRRFNSFPRK
jgi:hypothetical protein